MREGGESQKSYFKISIQEYTKAYASSIQRYTELY